MKSRFLPRAKTLLHRKCVCILQTLQCQNRDMQRITEHNAAVMVKVTSHPSQCRGQRRSYGPMHRYLGLWPRTAAMTVPRLCTDVESALPTFHHRLRGIAHNASCEKSSKPCGSCL
jgi:hypothetical protein